MPKCHRNLRQLKNKNSFFWACSGYKEGCKLTLDDVNGRPAPFYPCPNCQEPLRRVRTKGSWLWKCKGYPKACQACFEDFRGKPQFT